MERLQEPREPDREAGQPIRTPDQRVRVFISSTLQELAAERAAARRAVERLRLIPVMFELGARPHAPRELYRAYLAQSDVFVGIYWERYGWVAPGEAISGLEDEYRLAGPRPRLLYVKAPAPDREARLTELLTDVRDHDRVSYRRFATAEELEGLLADDLAVLLSERFGAAPGGRSEELPAAATVPEPLTPTVGRDALVGQVVTRLRRGARLVTLVGPGGIGKTRVAVEVARSMRGHVTDGVAFVDLSAVVAVERVVPTIAERLGIRLEGLRPAADIVVAALADHDQLLVLDNLEQLIAAVPQLTWVLERCPRLRVLATSRQRLGARGEQVVVVAPLTVPEPAASPRSAAAAPAVQLFLARAEAAGQEVTAPGDAQAMAAVAELCRRLEGVPLAIELAAARLRWLPPTVLLEHLGHVLDVPSAGGDLPARQRTLRATIDWSHDLLEPSEQALFARLSVFLGGATLEAIAAVCGDPGGHDPSDPAVEPALPDVLTTLGGLFDHSLVAAADPTRGPQPRFTMLETIRQYAAERLDRRGETERLRTAHLAYYAALGRQAQPYLCGPRQRDWAARFDAERANLRAAVTFGLARGHTAPVLQLTYDTAVYFYIRDAFDEPRDWLHALLAHPGALDDVGRANLDAMAAVGGILDDPAAATALRAAITVYRDHGRVFEGAVAQHHLGLVLWRLGQHEDAIAALEASVSAYDSLGHDWGVAIVQTSLGAIRTAEGDAAGGAARHRIALERARRIDNRPLIAQALQGLAMTEALAGDAAAAGRRVREAAELAVTERLAAAASCCLETLAELALQRGDPVRAVTLLATAEATRRRLQVPAWTATEGVAAGVLARARQRCSPESFAQASRVDEGDDPFARLAAELATLASATPA
jgi:predicted ATPase